MFSSSFTAVIVISVITLAFSAEKPNLKPGDGAPPFMIQARKADQYDTLEILKYGTNDSNIQGPIVFLAHTKRSGFLESLFSDPECFNKLIDISPDNVNYVFLFYADSAPTACNNEVKAMADEFANRFYDAIIAYAKRKRYVHKLIWVKFYLNPVIPRAFIGLSRFPQLSGIYFEELLTPHPPPPQSWIHLILVRTVDIRSFGFFIKNITFYLSVNFCSTKVQIECTFCSFPNGDGTAILHGHLSHAKVQPFAGWRQHLRFSVILIPWVLVRSYLRLGGPSSLLFCRLGSVLWVEPSTSCSAVKRSTDWAYPDAVFCSSISQRDGVRVGRVKGMAVPSTKLLQKVLYSMLWLQIQKIFSCFKVACGHSRLASLPPPSRLYSQASFSAEQTFFFIFQLQIGKTEMALQSSSQPVWWVWV